MKIREPVAERRRAVGIDLGTTHSLVAVMEGERPRVVTDSNGEALLPSAARFDENGELLVGRAALEGERPLTSVKRFMGRASQDIADAEGAGFNMVADAGGIAFETPEGRITPVEVSAAILAELKRRAEAELGASVEAAVVTVPAYFDEAQRRATADAARLAGLEVLRLLNEPTAAALSYGLDESDAEEGASGRIVAVYDLGGGTFDISILKLEGRVFEVLATGGDTMLGGDDFDRALIRNFAADLDGDLGEGDPARHRALMAEARRVREDLSDRDVAEFSWQGRALRLSRLEMETLGGPLIERASEVCRRCLKDAGLDVEDVDEVVLVGGATRMPMVRRTVQELFRRAPHVELDPDKVVAWGAARQAALLSGARPGDDTLLLDVTPLSLGLETLGGLVERVIPRNTPIPARRAREFTTAKDGQTGLSLHVLQGERDLVTECRSLAKFELKNIPPMAAGAARVQVVFEIDADGLLRVSAEERRLGISSQVEVRPSAGLPEARIADMLEDAFAHAEADKDARVLLESRSEAEQLLDSLDGALAEDGRRLLDESERRTLARAIETLKDIARGEDAKDIRLKIEALENASSAFIERRMDDMIEQALVGRTLAEAEKPEVDAEPEARLR